MNRKKLDFAGLFLQFSYCQIVSVSGYQANIGLRSGDHSWRQRHSLTVDPADSSSLTTDDLIATVSSWRRYRCRCWKHHCSH